MDKPKLGTALVGGIILAGFAGAAQATPPPTSPYFTDPHGEYVQDITSDGISSLNMVLCVIHAMNASSQVNAGPYIALVDMNKCDSKQASSSSAGATSFATATVDVTRATNNDPMVGKVWLSMSQEGKDNDIFAYLSVTASPSGTQPYGLFRLDYLGKSGGATQFNGFIDSQPTSISQFETGQNSSDTAMTLSATSTTAGSGTISSNGSTSYDFAFDANYFRRSDHTVDQCFDRSRANAQVSVWQYGTYNANDGTRVDLAHPGFPIQATYGGTAYYGFANYWGINFQGLDLNSLADAQPVANLTIVDQRPSNTSTYSLSKVGGKLTKWQQQATTLDSLNGIPVSFYGDLTGATTGNGNVTGWGSWIIKWDSTSHSFSVTGTQQCGNNGCVQSALTPAATINVSYFASTPISGFAESYGGQINIPPTGVAHAASDPVYYFSQSTVVPGSQVLSLYCLNQCPTAASLVAFKAGDSQSSPFLAATAQQWFSAQAGNTVSYSFDAGGLKEGSTAMVAEQASDYPQGSQFAQSGINTGRLFDAPLSSGNCPVGFQGGMVCEPGNPTTYYTWSTGQQQWSQSLWLTHGGTVVPFDAPQNIQYTVPAGAAYGSYAGLPILLQFNGFGNLYGIPGNCVDPVNNAATDCSTPNARYVPEFSIADGTALTLPSPSTPLLVKALNAEIRLRNLGASASSPCAGMTLTPATLPSGGTHDPSSSSDSKYLGTKPVVTAAPKVIDGVVQ